MSCINVPVSTLQEFAAGTLSHSAMVAKIKSILNPQRTGVSVNGGTPQFIKGMRGITWVSYATLKDLGLARTYGAVANGRWLPVNADDEIIPGHSWKGSTRLTLVRKPA